MSSSAVAPAPAALDTDARRPALIVVAVDISPERGSEPGKAWNWCCALARQYRLHVVTGSALDPRCREHPAAAEWTWHLTPSAQPIDPGLSYYRHYARWCDEALAMAQAVIAREPVAGIHHITLGSFRVLPRYDRLGVPYTLGPLGGGEVAPPAYLRTARMPWRQRAAERLRPWINLACVRRPGVPPVLRGAGLVLATTPETERLLRRGGAGNVAVAFPDCTPTDAAAAALATRNDDRAAALADGVRLIWFGRALWWKGGQLAIELLRRLAATGVPCELSIHSFGAALESWRTRIAALGLSARCRIPGYVDRQTLLEELARTHVFVYPTIHDSSSSALLEAYAMGVPSLSTGVGGPALVATPATGYNERTPDLEAWLGAAVARAQQWQRDPAAWMAASAAARARAAEFGPGHVVRLAERWLSPAAYQR